MAVQPAPLSMPHWVLHGYLVSHLKLLARLLHFVLRREPWHPVKMIEIAFAISVPHQVAIRVLLNKKFQSKLTTLL